MDPESSQQFQMWFSEHFVAPKLTELIVTPIVSATVEQKWREKMSEKPLSSRLLRWFNLSQSGSRKNNRKTLEGTSVEPTNYAWTKANFWGVLWSKELRISNSKGMKTSNFSLKGRPLKNLWNETLVTADYECI